MVMIWTTASAVNGFTEVSASTNAGLSLAVPSASSVDKYARKRRYFRWRFGVVWERLRTSLVIAWFLDLEPQFSELSVENPAVVGCNRSADQNSPFSLSKTPSKSVSRKLSTLNYGDVLAPFDSSRQHLKMTTVQVTSQAGHSVTEFRPSPSSDLSEVFGTSFYWGAIDRLEAESVLDSKQEGTFLLRNSAHVNYLFSVSFRKYDRTLHARIESRDGRYGFDRADATAFAAPTVAELIRHYDDPNKCMYFEPQLSHPLNRTFTFTLAEICRATIVGCCADFAALPLPFYLQRFVGEFWHKPPAAQSNSAG